MTCTNTKTFRSIGPCIAIVEASPGNQNPILTMQWPRASYAAQAGVISQPSSKSNGLTRPLTKQGIRDAKAPPSLCTTENVRER